jgi:hypothetical protein
MLRRFSVPILGASVLLAFAFGRSVLAAPRTGHTLTLADNNSTVTANPGDIITLTLPPASGYVLSAANSSNPSVVQALGSSVAASDLVWQVQSAGVATITATGSPACTPNCGGYPLYFTATVDSGGAGQVQTNAPSAGPTVASVTYPAGANLIGVPSGTVLQTVVYSLDGAGNQVPVPAGTPLVGGTGYWAYFAAPTTVNLPAGSTSATVQAPAGGYVLVGNPSATADASIRGADLLQQFNAALQVFLPLYSLPPGSAALAYSNNGGTITVSAATP